MSKLLPGSISTSKPAYTQVEAFLRRAIVEKRFAPGDRLPTLQKLAEQFGTSVFTIQSALVPLVKEGLVECSPRRGTFVAGARGKITCVGIYCEDDFRVNPWRGLYREVYGELSRILTQNQIHLQLWSDPRPIEQQQEALPEIQRAIKGRKIQAFIATAVNAYDIQWIRTLKIPFSVMGSPPFPCRVVLDYKQMVKMSLEALKAQGCRSIGVVFPWPIWGPMKTDHVEDVAGVFPVLIDEAARQGLALRNEWVRAPLTAMRDRDYEEFGYVEFMKLWKQEERPDGLLVYPDLIGRGVISAILRLGIRVPEDLKVVLHHREGAELFCPLPVSWIVSSPQKCAMALVDQIRSQSEGREVSPIHVPFVFEPAA